MNVYTCETETLLQCEQIVLGALLQAPHEASNAIGDLPAEALTIPEHRDIFWQLLVDDVQPKDATRLRVWGQSFRDRTALLADAVEIVRSSWTERRLSAGGGEPGFPPELVPANDVAALAMRRAA